MDKKIILDRNKLDFQKPGQSIERISIFLSNGDVLYEDGLIAKKYLISVSKLYYKTLLIVGNYFMKCKYL